MSAFNDAWMLLKQRSQPQMSLLPFGFATGNPAQDALAYLGAGPGAQEGPMTVPQSELDNRYEEFLDRQKTRGVPQYQLDVTRDEKSYTDSKVGLKPYLMADGQSVGKFPMAPTETARLRRDITRGRGHRPKDVVAHTSGPIDELITDYHGNTHFMDSTTSIPEASFYPTGSAIDDEHRGKGLYIRSLLSLLSTPEAMGLSAKDVAREDALMSDAPSYNLSEVDPQLFDELYGQRGLMSPPSRTGGKGGSDRSHELLSERYKKIMDLLGEDLHTYGEGQTLSNIIDMAERGEGMFRSHGAKLKHNLLEGSISEEDAYRGKKRPLVDPETGEALKDPRGKTFFYDPISVDVGKNPLERETFGDLRRFDLAGLPVRVKRPVTPTERKRLKQTRLGDFEPPLPDIDLGDGPVSAESIINRERERRGREQQAMRNLEELTSPRRRDRAFTRQREQRIQEAIDSLGGLFTSYQDARQMAGDGFNERLVNTGRDIDIKNSLKFFNEHMTNRTYDEYGMAYPNAVDDLPRDMSTNISQDVLFLTNMQDENSRPDAIREALRRAEEQFREQDGVPGSNVFDPDMIDVFDPDVAAERTIGSGAMRRNYILEEIDKAITRVRILNHHLRTYPEKLSGGGGPLEQEQAHILLRNHLDDLFHPIGGYMMGYNEDRV